MKGKLRLLNGDHDGVELVGQHPVDHVVRAFLWKETEQSQEGAKTTGSMRSVHSLPLPRAQPPPWRYSRPLRSWPSPPASGSYTRTGTPAKVTSLTLTSGVTPDSELKVAWKPSVDFLNVSM